MPGHTPVHSAEFAGGFPQFFFPVASLKLTVPGIADMIFLGHNCYSLSAMTCYSASSALCCGSVCHTMKVGRCMMAGV